MNDGVDGSAPPRRATIYDVAERAGVSHQTVSRYLRGFEGIRPTSRDRIAHALDELDYKINIPARNLRLGRTGAISLAVPSLNQPYFAELAQSVIGAARERGLTVFVETTEGDPERERDVLLRSRGHLVDGLLFAPSTMTSEQLRAENPSFPLVLLGDRLYGSGYPHIAMANERGAFAAVEHLLRTGRRRIAAIGVEEPEREGASALRRRGYHRALHAAGIAPDPELEWTAGQWVRADGAEAALRLVASGVDFDAVFAFNDALALGALRTLHGAGIAVPDTVAVIGFDDTEDATYATPSLSSISPGRAEIAQRALTTLEAIIAGGDVLGLPEQEVEFSLIVRESTAAAAAAPDRPPRPARSARHEKTREA